MSLFVDLSHDFYDGMPGFRLVNEDGSYTQFSASVSPFLTHEQTRPKFKENVSFEISQIEFQSSIGTYLDSPYHRYANKRDISQIRLDEVILEGLVVDLRGQHAWDKMDAEILNDTIDLQGKAVLFNFGWDHYWGTDQYHSYPFISKKVVEHLVEKGVKLVGVDTINIDNSKDLTRPAHSLFLQNDILIVENLTNLEQLHGKTFRFFAVPIKAKKVTAMPIRAFAEILEK